MQIPEQKVLGVGRKPPRNRRKNTFFNSTNLYMSYIIFRLMKIKNKRELSVFLIIIISYINVPCSSQQIYSDNTEYWGIIINLFDDDANREDSLYLKELLCSHGWEENHLNVSINSNITKQDVVNLISWLDEREDENDISLIFINSHGGHRSMHLYQGVMYYSELNDEVNKLESKGIHIALGQCHSGGAIPYLQNGGRVIITACAVNETSIGFGNGNYQLALAGLGDYYGNNNGYVSAEEIFNYINVNPFDGRHPQISDEYSGELNLLSLSPSDRRVDQQQLSFSHNVGLGGQYLKAQSFKPSSALLSKIKICVYKWPSVVSPLKLSIRQNLSGDDLVSTSIYGTHLLNFTDYLLEFDFPDINTNPGQTYYIVLSAPDAYPTTYGLKSQQKDEYNEGELYSSTDDGLSWEQYEHSSDLLFITYNNENLPPYRPIIPVGKISGIINMTYNYATVTTDPEDDSLYYFFDWDDGTNTGWLGPYNSGSNCEAQHTWDKKGEYEIKVKARDENNHESDWSLPLLVKIDKDFHPPCIHLDKPENAFYISNKMIRKYLFRNALIIGNIKIQATATDNETGINRVEFYINDYLRENDTTPPYEYIWRKDEIRFFRHHFTIKVVAFDNARNCASEEVSVWKFF